jgi:hypothetical protein
VRGFLLTLLVLAALVLLIVPYFVLPPALENLVARDVQDGLGLAERPGVELESDPQWEDTPRRVLERQGLYGGGGPRRGASEESRYRVGPLQRGRGGEPCRAGRPSSPEACLRAVRLTVSEDEVSRLAGQNAEVPVNGVELKGAASPWSPRLRCWDDVPGGGGRGRRSSKATPWSSSRQTVRAAGMTVPGYLADSLLAGTAFRYPVEGLPYGGSSQERRPVDGACRAHGEGLRGGARRLITPRFVAKVSRGRRKSWRGNLGPDPVSTTGGKPHPER